MPRAAANYKVRQVIESIGVPYEIRTRVTAVKEENHCNSMELGGMDSTLPHLKDFGERLLDY